MSKARDANCFQQLNAGQKHPSTKRDFWITTFKEKLVIRKQFIVMKTVKLQKREIIDTM